MEWWQALIVFVVVAVTITSCISALVKVIKHG